MSIELALNLSEKLLGFILKSKKRNADITAARHCAVYIIRKSTNLSQKDVGRMFNKDHTTILYSIKKVESALAGGDKSLQDHIRDITANINSCL